MRRVAAPETCPPRWPPGRPRPRRRSAMARSTSSARSCRRATSRSSSSATRRARSSPSASATARSSAATRSSSRSRRRPASTDAERGELHELAVRLGRAAGLGNAATAEFLFDEERRFWFLEVNTRLQVEHGVTELVADVDLVREQLLVAAGRPAVGADRRRRGGVREHRCVTRSRSGSRPRTRRATSPRPPAGSGAGGCRPGRASGSTPASRPATASHRTTTR